MARVLALAAVFAVAFALLGSRLGLSWIQEASPHLGMLAGVAVVLLMEREPLAFVGLAVSRGFWKELGLGAVWGALSIALVLAGMLYLTHEMEPGTLSRPGAGQVMDMLAFWGVVALGEEVLFRGYILSALRRGLPAWAAVTVSALLFSSIHVLNPDYYPFAFVYAFLIGALFGWVVIRRSGLACVIGFHAAWNLLQDDRLLRVPDRGGEVLYAGVLLVNLVLVARWMPRRTAVTAAAGAAR